MNIVQRYRAFLRTLAAQGFEGDTSPENLEAAIKADPALRAVRIDINTAPDGSPEKRQTLTADRAAAILIPMVSATDIVVEDVEEEAAEEVIEDVADETPRAGRIAGSHTRAQTPHPLANGVLTAGRISSRAASRESAAARRYNANAQFGRSVGSSKKTMFADAEEATAAGAVLRLKLTSRAGAPPIEYSQRARDLDVCRAIMGDDAARALSSGTLGSGGDWSITEVLPGMIDVLLDSSSARRMVDFQTTSTEAGHMPKTAGRPTVYSVLQGNSITASDPATQRVRFFLKDFFALTYASRSWFDDIPLDAGERIVSAHAGAHGLKESDAIINGDGGDSYGGIVGVVTALNNVASNAGVFAQGTGNTWAAMTWADIVKPQGRTRQRVNANEEIYVCHKAFFGDVMMPLAQEAGEGRRIQTEFFPDGTGGLVGGRRVIFNPYMPSTTATDTISLLYGDFNSCMLAVEKTGGLDIAQDESFRFDTDELAFRTKNRFDLQIHDPGTSSEAGSVVALKTGS